MSLFGDFGFEPVVVVVELFTEGVGNIGYVDDGSSLSDSSELASSRTGVRERERFLFTDEELKEDFDELDCDVLEELSVDERSDDLSASASGCGWDFLALLRERLLLLVERHENPFCFDLSEALNESRALF